MDCAHAPAAIVALKALAPTIKDIGPTVGILSAAAAWLVNRFLGWCVWMVERFLKRRDLMRAILAEIDSNSQAEAVFYPRAGPAEKRLSPAFDLIESLRAQVGPEKPLAPYVAIVPGNPIYAKAIESIALLPGGVIGAIVAYYSASESLTNQLTDFRSEPFLTLSHDRQTQIIKGVWDIIGAEVERSANAARRSLRQSLRRGSLIQFLSACAAGVVTATAIVKLASWSTTVIQAAEWASSCPQLP